MGKSSIFYLSELFGPSFQGEGKNLGMPCMFLRLAGCNLRCAWCDTRYSWDFREGRVHQMSEREIMFALEHAEMKHPALCITGGEPMLQRKPLEGLCRDLHENGWYIEIETSGTIAPNTIEMADLFNVSPKLANSGNPLHKRIIPEVLETFAASGRANFKFVAQKTADFDEIDELVTRFGLWPVYIMPEGNCLEKVLLNGRQVAEATIERGYFLTTRLQILLYGNRRGV